MSAPVETLLSCLDKVKRTGQDRWIACCPAHGDKSPSLTIRELDDGRVLLHCFAGCDTASVLAAAGLDMTDLYPDRNIHHGKPERRPFPAADVLRAIAFEAMVVATCAVSMMAGQPFTETDRERLIVAVSRIQAGIDAAGCNHG
jgi:hypothetical protein